MPAVTVNERYNNFVTVTKSDTANIYGDGGLTDAVQFGETGVVAVVAFDGTVINMTVQAGWYYPIAIKRINSTNTAGTLFTAWRAV